MAQRAHHRGIYRDMLLVLLCLALSVSATVGGDNRTRLPVDAVFFLENQEFPSEAYSVSRLQHWLGQACGASPPVVTTQPKTGRWIAVGHRAAAAAGLAPPSDLLGPPPLAAPPTNAAHDSFAVRCSGGNCAVSGSVGSLRGSMYGVYELLERWGFKFLAYDTVIVPPCPSALVSINTTVRPSMNYRQISDVYTEPARPSCTVPSPLNDSLEH